MLPAANLVQVLLNAAHYMPTYVSLAALFAFLLLLALYLSQRRDLVRMRAWMEGEPGHPAEDLARSEALLDDAETELEAILGVEPAPVAATAVQTAVGPPAAAPGTPTTGAPPITGERPALTQITTEREALRPHPRWRRFVTRASQPRVLGLIAAGAVVLGLAGIFGSDKLLNNSSESGPVRKPGAVVPHNITVAVLNGTSVPSLGAKVASDVQVNNFKLGTVTVSRKQYDQTIVMYETNQKNAADKVAHDLGVEVVQPIDRQTQKEAGGADVVVIAGGDRTKP